jgi:hypothetical protein
MAQTGTGKKEIFFFIYRPVRVINTRNVKNNFS